MGPNLTHIINGLFFFEITKSWKSQRFRQDFDEYCQHLSPEKSFILFAGDLLFWVKIGLCQNT